MAAATGGIRAGLRGSAHAPPTRVTGHAHSGHAPTPAPAPAPPRRFPAVPAAAVAGHKFEPRSGAALPALSPILRAGERPAGLPRVPGRERASQPASQPASPWRGFLQHRRCPHGPRGASARPGPLTRGPCPLRCKQRASPGPPASNQRDETMQANAALRRTCIPYLAVREGSAGFTNTEQLRFNRNVPAVPENLAVRFSPCRPIIIEKLKASNDQRHLTGSEDVSVRSSGVFSVLSEERLKLAIQLAKRDIKRRHLEEQVKQQTGGDAVNKLLLAHKLQQQKPEVFESPENKNVQKSQNRLKYQQKLGQPNRVETTTSGAKVYVYAPNRGKLIPAVSEFPPTCDTGPDPRPCKEDKNRQEIERLQKQLRTYVQKIKELTEKEREREILDPDTEQRVRIRRQEQAARSARMLYALQQQVKEIQDDLEKLSLHKIKHTKKSRAASRLAAAQRGAVRALQVFASQFTDQIEQQIPTHCKELVGLIRQLSLCSAKLENDSSVSDVIIDILMQVEDLDSLLKKKETHRKVKKCISASQDKSPRSPETFPVRKQLTSPKGENKPLVLKRQHGREPRRPPAARSLLPEKHRHVANISAVQKAISDAPVLHNEFQEENAPPAPERNATLQGDTDALVRARPAKKDPSGPRKKKSVPLPAKSWRKPKSLESRQVQPQGKHARFQETTIAFQLKENKRLVKKSGVLRVPPVSTSQPASPERQAWLHAEASGRAKVLTDFSTEEKKKVQNLRSQSASPIRYADKVEKAVRERLEPPVDRTQQVVANADIVTEKLSDDLLENTAQEPWRTEQHESLQIEALPVADTHILESMLQRLEEIERYEEAVRRRFTQIVYTDSEFWAQEDKKEQQVASIAERPTSPHPIQITKIIGCTEPKVEILLEKPLDGNDVDENNEAEVKLQTGNNVLRPLTRNSLRKGCCVSVSVPKRMLQSILDYKSRYEHHLKLISHEAVGSFNPWQIAESLAEQLLEEALCDVTAELQDACEDYAEAVFTSEFLQPAQ